ncbi:multicomponent Na+:H+ antiporter subunit G [Breoghania corrubedonensis]|uniref:Multicomponent Na+:H+ antiporter subunit G n=1 Tax=Breoghania corrubedonensis TaxID=665038 RepID=A0A2T5V1Q8_9HYPH|nr:monovalent cation/H(+) antiporter subunit G [Breoghania corrubedonensis]PTW57691.1 multicomponent Na+:H+ antiporter subunit G [Breoghania corrubedonensis]
MTSVIVGCALVVGSFFCFTAALGLARFKDVYMRMHAASKAGTLGSGVLLLALAVHAGELDVVTRAIAGVIFFMLTAPVSAHLLARAAYIVGYKPCDATVIDELAEAQDGKKQ